MYKHAGNQGDKISGVDSRLNDILPRVNSELINQASILTTVDLRIGALDITCCKLQDSISAATGVEPLPRIPHMSIATPGPSATEQPLPPVPTTPRNGPGQSPFTGSRTEASGFAPAALATAGQQLPQAATLDPWAAHMAAHPTAYATQPGHVSHVPPMPHAASELPFHARASRQTAHDESSR